MPESGDSMGKRKLNIAKLKRMKEVKDPISMVTAYDYPSARLAEEAGVDLILVGDSLGNVVLGCDSTIPVTLEDMVYHTRAAARGAEHTMIVTDMPFMTYHGSIDSTMRNVAALMQQGMANALKLEGGTEIADTVSHIVSSGVPVMGHIGLTPQSVYQLSGYKIQGKTSREAENLIDSAKALEQAGAFAVVLECITAELAEVITGQISIPTIGIGAGASCDGQVLVFHDLLQYHGPDGMPKKFVKTYADIGEQARRGIANYVADVKERKFPDEAHSFQSQDELKDYLYGGKESK